MYLTDFHLHSKFSADGREKMEAICRKALEMGISEIAITDHVDIMQNREYTSRWDKAGIKKDLQSVREKFEGQLIIRNGVELGQPHINTAQAEKFYKENEFDFIIGSVHSFETEDDIYYYDYNTMDCNAVFKRYLQSLHTLVECYDFDVIGHITYPLRYMAAFAKKTVDTSLLKKELEELFYLVVQKGRGIELNTSGLRQEIGEPFPNAFILKLYKQCKGTIITLGSDAHFVKDVGAGIREGQKMLKEIGFSSVATFENRSPIFHKI